MKHFFMYLYLEMKRMFKSFPSVFFITVLLMIGLAVLTWMQITIQNNEEGKKKIAIGIVGDEKDSYLELGISIIENTDASRYTLEFVSLEEQEAKTELMQGNIHLYIFIPEGFVDSVMYGSNMPVTIVTNASNQGLISDLIYELAETVSLIVTESQTGIYTFIDIHSKYTPKEDLKDAIMDLNLKYFNYIFARDKMYNLEIVDSSYHLSLLENFICAGILIFFLLWGMNGGTLLIRPDMSFGKLLAAQNMSVHRQTLCEFGAYLSFFLTNIAGILLLSMITLHLIPTDVFDFSKNMVLFAIKLLPVILCICALQFMIYSLADELLSGLLLNFLCTLFLGYVSGCFYPLNYLPATIQNLSSFLPTGICMEYMSLVLQEKSILLCLGKLLVYSFVFLLISYGIKKYKIQR